MRQAISVGTRQWDHVFPLAMGDVRVPNGSALSLSRLEATPDLWSDERWDASETSFSRYIRKVAQGDRSVIGLPYFLMRGFRHRCIIVTKQSNIHSLSQLQGRRIGVTGWPDSGNTWTRQLLTDSGVPLEDINWYVGRLTEDHPTIDRMDGTKPPPHFSVMTGQIPMVNLLEDNKLDAIFTPFMPPGFENKNSKLRPLFHDLYKVESSYYESNGFIPGIHLLAVKREVAETTPQCVYSLQQAFRESEKLAMKRHRKLQDVTPWLSSALLLCKRANILDPNPVGVRSNRKMIEKFMESLIMQGLLQRMVPIDELFPFDYLDSYGANFAK